MEEKQSSEAGQNNPKEILRKELDERLQSLFNSIEIGEDNPLNAVLNPSRPDPDSKAFYALKINKETFSDSGIRDSICEALFGGESPADFIISLHRIKDKGTILTIMNAGTNLLSEEKYLTLASTVDAGKPFVIAVPSQFPIAQPTYKPENLDTEREDCFAVINTVETIAKQLSIIKQ